MLFLSLFLEGRAVRPHPTYDIHLDTHARMSKVWARTT